MAQLSEYHMLQVKVLEVTLLLMISCIALVVIVALNFQPPPVDLMLKEPLNLLLLSTTAHLKTGEC